MGGALGGETGDVFVISDKDLKTTGKMGGGSRTRNERGVSDDGVVGNG